MRNCFFAALFSITLALAGCSSEPAPTGAAADRGEAKPSTFDTIATPPADHRDAGEVAQTSRGDAAEKSASSAQTDGAAAGRSSDRGGARPMPREAASTPGAAHAEPETVSQAKEAAREPLRRESLAGRWEFVLYNREHGVDIVGLLLNVEQDGDALRVTLVDDSPMMPDWRIASSNVSGNAVEIQFTSHTGSEVDFRGEFQEDGVVRGNVAYGESGLDLVRWVPSERDSLEDADPSIPLVGVEKLKGFRPGEADPIGDVWKKARELGPSALGYEMFRSLSGGFRGQQPEEAAFAGFPEEYIAAARPWGERVVTRAHLDIASTMAACGYSPETARQHFDRAEEAFGPDPSPALQRLLNLTKGLVYVRLENPDDQSTGRTLLEQIRDENPYDTQATRGLAAFHERNRELEPALALYSELAALPTGASDITPVARIWKELGRDSGEIDAYLDEIYRSRVHEFADETSDAPRADGPWQIILGELFTGGSCPPCVSADIATGGLEITYPKSELIMLRYHQHVPGPDPLTIAAGDERAADYYRIEGTPTLYFNGQPVETALNMYGPIDYAAAGYTDLRQVVDPLLTQSTEVTIELKAAVSGDDIAITATVGGVETIPDTWRLRLCLAEDEIAYAARNGIRLHEMVVRTMPGGAAGIAPTDGALSYSETISLAAVRDEIREYVATIRGLPAPPLELEHLHVVAFVQDDATHSVLQAAAVGVQGLPPAEATTGDADASPAPVTSE